MSIVGLKMNSTLRFTTSLFLIFLLIGSSVMVSSTDHYTDLLEFSYSFSEPDLIISQEDDEKTIRVQADDLFLTGEAEYPQLPFTSVNIMLPIDAESYRVNVEGDQFHIRELPEDFSIKTNGMVQTFSDTIIEKGLTDDYQLYPEQQYEVLDLQYKHGVKILTVVLYPYQYDKVNHDLRWIEEMNIKVSVSFGTIDETVHRSDQKIKHTHWNELTENPEMITSYSSVISQEHNQLDPYDYVLITSETFLNSSGYPYDFYDLLDAREQMGLTTFVKTVEDIRVEYVGVDVQERIRNFIIDMYENHNTSYVLLGGDLQFVPIRFLDDVDGMDPTEKKVSSDLYYQCLDGTYDYDNDGNYGERHDGPSASIPDLFAEVYLGRAPVDSLADVSSFVEKTLMYEQGDLLNDDYLKQVISAGEYVWNGEGGYGAGYLELCIDHDEDYDQITDGIPSNRYDILKRYERDNDWTELMIMTDIDAGAAIINHVGHGSPVSAMKLSVSDIDRLHNEGMYGLFYSQACHSGQVEVGNCIAEKWVIAEQKGGFASIMNTGFGYGSTSSYDGADNRYAREFYDALFSPSEGISRLGIAHMDAKEDNYYRINEDNMIHVYYNKILLGDPYVEIKGAENTNALFSYQPDYPITGEAITFTDESTGWLNLWQWDFDDGDVSYAQSPTHAFDYEGIFQVKLTVRDTLGYQSSVIKEIEVRDQWPPVAKVTPSSHQGMNVSVSFSAEDSFDPDGDIVLYQWSFGDDTTSTEMDPVHIFPGYGSYQVRLAVTDDDDLMDTVFCSVILEEQFPPQTPETPVGSTTLALGDETTYSSSAIDPENNLVQYHWRFGDDGVSEWTRFYQSEETCVVNHIWQTGGDQFVQVKARDEFGMESDWSEPLEVYVADENAPIIDLVSPENAVYLRSLRLFSFSQPVLIGRNMISVNVSDEGGVDKVVFYLDDEAVAEVNSAPYEWQWRPPVFLPKKITVRIQAFDVAGNQASTTVDVFKIF